jgi:2Fe-2S ferredoxin
MVKVKFVSASGGVIDAECSSGCTLMECASNHMVAEIEAQCGGGCACGTCHCYPRIEWLDKLPPMEDIEACTLEGGMAEIRPTSRLACQIELTEELSGLIIDLPEIA